MTVLLDKAKSLYASISKLPSSLLKAFHSYIRRIRGWRVTVLTGMCMCLVVLIFNVSLMIWSNKSTIESEGDILNVYNGDCTRMKGIMTYSHLTINVLSTLLLSASTAGMQCVSSPTRKDIDYAHKNGVWLHVGVLGFRNFRWIPKWRRVIWVLLAISSIPIHLLYNSVIFSTRSTNDYYAFVVAPDFLSGGEWLVPTGLPNLDNSAMPTDDYWQINDIQKHAQSLVRLDMITCLHEYNQDYVTKWGNFLAVTAPTNNSNSLIYAWRHLVTDRSDPTDNLICRWSDSADCTMYSNISTNTAAPYWNLTVRLEYYDGGTYAMKTLGVDYCLAQERISDCQMSLSSSVLSAVILCNFFKLLCLALTAAAADFEPLVTIGDAIKSFLVDADSTTNGFGPVSAMQVRLAKANSPRKINYNPVSQPWRNSRPFWFEAATRSRWAFVVSSCVVVWVLCFVLLVVGTSETGLSQFWKNVWSSGIGGRVSQGLVSISEGKSVSANILLANTPQLVISLIYVLYNGLFTCMLLTAETVDFASERKTLRVSNPTGRQRSTYWLQLPYRYALPLMTIMAILHWLISQSLFLARITVYNTAGKEDPDRKIYGCGWSGLALFCSLIVGACLIGCLVAHGFRRYKGHMPILASNSLAISAACHRGSFENGNIVERPLQYGILTTDENRIEKRLGFSAKDVGPCVEGELYH